LHSLALIGYCLMSNHVHLLITPGKPDPWPGVEGHTRQIRRLLECCPSFQRPRLAGQILFLPLG
jgi:REP element-mobilizing transposase RayT